MHLQYRHLWFIVTVGFGKWIDVSRRLRGEVLFDKMQRDKRKTSNADSFHLHHATWNHSTWMSLTVSIHLCTGHESMPTILAFQSNGSALRDLYSMFILTKTIDIFKCLQYALLFHHTISNSNHYYLNEMVLVAVISIAIRNSLDVWCSNCSSSKIDGWNIAKIAQFKLIAIVKLNT